MPWRSFESSYEIMARFVLRRLILQTRMRSNPVGLDVCIFCPTLCLRPYFMCANSEGSGQTARMRRLARAFAGRLCDKYHNLMSWLISLFSFSLSYLYRTVIDHVLHWYNLPYPYHIISYRYCSKSFVSEGGLLLHGYRCQSLWSDLIALIKAE